MVRGPGTRHLPLTVLMTADAVGGVWSYAAWLCRALPEIDFILAIMGPAPSPAQRDEIAKLNNAVLVESGYNLEWMAISGAELAKSRDWLVALAEHHHVDVIHVNGYAHAQLGTDLPILLVAHSDVSSWWQAVHKRAAPPEWDQYREQVAAGLTAATRIVAPTAAVLRDLERHYVRLRDKTGVISNGTDFNAFLPLPKAPVVMAAGRIWDAAKNLATLEAIAPDLAWPVEIAGEIEHPEGHTVRYSNVRLLGRLTHAELAWHLGCASIFAAPARYEPFGLAILEAAAAGCALVLGDIPSLRENWDGVAVFVDPEDRSALKSAIDNLIANPGERNRLAAAGRCRAQDFTLPRMARAYAGLYRTMTRTFAKLETA